MAERLIDRALRLDPANPLAHHLRIHLTEAASPTECAPRLAACPSPRTPLDHAKLLSSMPSCCLMTSHALVPMLLMQQGQHGPISPQWCCHFLSMNFADALQGCGAERVRRAAVCGCDDALRRALGPPRSAPAAHAGAQLRQARRCMLRTCYVDFPELTPW